MLFMPFWILLGFLGLAGLGASANAAVPTGPLVWNVLTNEYTAKPGDISAHLFFMATNISTEEVNIDGVKTSCGCTSAKLPSDPWRLAPKESGRMDITVDLRGKSGTLFKSVTVQSTNAAKELLIKVTIPPGGTNTLSSEMANRLWNQEMSAADHQAVFKGDCVKCHLEPAFGKSGAALYKVACGICHDSPHRATMVPDLKDLVLKKETGTNYWRSSVAHGKAGTLMPGFAATEGGPLDDDQINSLVDFLMAKYPPVKKEESPDDDDDD
jgi:cytochrome c553